MMRGDVIGTYDRRFALRDRKTEDQLRAKAIDAAQGLRMQMDQPFDWRIRVHQNLGWHYSIFRQTNRSTISVHVSGPVRGRPTYWAMLSAGRHSGGASPMYWHDEEHKRFLNPNRAVERALKLARDHVNEVTAVVESQERMQ